MFVVMDIEWYPNARKNVTTQLAGIRFDNDFTIADDFFVRMKPGKGLRIEWNHIGFNGAPKEAFINGMYWIDAYESFQKWLQEDDILLWWSEEPMQHFLEEYNRIIGRMKNDMHVIGKYVSKLVIPKGKDSNVESLCRKNGIKYSTESHVSINDAGNILALLKGLQISAELILASPAVKRQNWDIPLSHKTKYVFTDDNLIHWVECPERVGKEVYEKFNKMSPALHYRPCKCCRQTWMDSAANIKKLPTVLYFDMLHGDEVHFKDCSRLSGIQEDDIGLFTDVNQAKTYGYHLCPECREKGYTQAEIDRFCRENGLEITQNDSDIIVKSKNAVWLIRQMFGEMVLYHMNARSKDAEYNVNTQYHYQNCRSHDLMGILEYIVQHDHFKKRSRSKHKRMDKSVRTDTTM